MLLAPSSCGFGSAAVASTTGNSQGNANPVLGDLSVVDPSDPSLRAATSPAQVRFRLTDGDGDASSVSIDYSTDGGASFRPITTPNSLTDLAPGDYQMVWDYLADLGDESYQNGLQLRATVAGGNSVIASPIAMGNDPPQIDPAAFTLPAADPEPEGNVQVGFAVKDSAGDQVDIRVEFNQDASGGFPESSWQLARSVGVDVSSDTPPFALNNLEPPANGQGLLGDFFWESDFAPAPTSSVSPQMASIESDVKLRFTPLDAYGAEGAAVETDPFRIDNNRPPQAVFEEGDFLVGVKDRGAIPIGFKIFDDESDDVQVAIQWKPAGDEYPTARNSANQQVDLATLSPEELRDLLENPARAQDRRDAQIAQEAPLAFQGRLGTLAAGLPADQVRLPEVAGSQAGLLALGIEGRTLEVLGTARLETRTGDQYPTWSATTLNTPVDAHILEAGITALILEQGAAPSSWQVREIDLATGAIVTTLAQGSGAPKSMDVDPTDRVLFVGSGTHIFRIQMYTGAALGDPIIHSFGDGLRCLAALGDQVVLATGDVSDGVSVDGQLRRFDFSPSSSGQDAILLSGLATPWGLALDPLRTTAVYLAESGFDNGGNPPGRVVSVNLDQLVLESIPALIRLSDVGTLSETAFPGVKSIALEDGGRKLLAVTEWNNGAGLRRLALRSPWDRSQPADGQAAPFVEQVAVLNESVGGLVTGPDRLRIVTRPAASLLMIGGGVAQRRSILEYDPTQQIATLNAALDPVPAPGDRAKWRVQTPVIETAGAPDGLGFTYVWDSSEVPDPTGVELRVIARDADPGVSSVSTAPKPYRTDFEFDSTVFLSTGPDVSAFTAADLDNDGDMDLVLADADGDTLTLLLQVFPGIFTTAPATLPTGSAPNSVTVADLSVSAADLDGDEDIDLVLANSNDSTLTLYFQEDEIGVFEQAPQTLSTGPEPADVTAADLDGDGDMDLVSADAAGNTLTLFFQTSPGVFTPSPNTLQAGQFPRDIAAADLDGDGDMDLVSANTSGNSLTLFFQKDTEPGGFEPATQALPTGLAPWAVAAADLDGDGDVDLVSADEVGNTLTLFFQMSPGSFTPAPATLPTGSAPTSVSAADLDGDGDVDLVSANNNNKTLTLFFQTSPGRFTPADTSLDLPPQAGPAGFNYAYVAAADLDGDGNMELIATNGAGPILTIFSPTSAGSFAPGTASLSTNEDPNCVAAADLDGDGDTDIVSSSGFTNTLTPFFQTSPGRFAPAETSLPSGLTPRSVVATDLDADGDVDLVSANTDDSSLTLFFQKDAEPGVFEQGTQTLSTGDQPWDVAAADLDGDGDVDLVSANRVGNNLTLFFQISQGSFAPALAPLPTGAAPESVAAADLDGDGDVDLVSADESGNTLTLFFQTSPGSFTPAPATLPMGSSPRSVAAADLDGDGDIDLVSAAGDTLTLFFQTSPGVFAPASDTLPAGNGVLSVAAADLDGDGDTDLVSAGGNTLTLLFQTSTGDFTLGLGLLPTGVFPTTVAAADLDGDGDLDLVSTAPVNSTLRLFFNGK